jgi:hypothetical protein
VGGKWWIKSIYNFDSMKGKSQVTQKRLYSEYRNRGKALGIMKGVTRWQKNRETKASEKSSKQFQACLGFLDGRWEVRLKTASQV